MATFETTLGPCGIAWTDRGITEVFLPRRVPLAHVPLPASASGFGQQSLFS